MDQLHSGIEVGIALHEEELFKKLSTFLSDSHKISKWRGSANCRAGVIQECPPPPTCPAHPLDLPLLTCKLCVIIYYIKKIYFCILRKIYTFLNILIDPNLVVLRSDVQRKSLPTSVSYTWSPFFVPEFRSLLNGDVNVAVEEFHYLMYVKVLSK